MEPSVQPAGNRVNLRLYIGAEAVMTDLVRSKKNGNGAKPLPVNIFKQWISGRLLNEQTYLQIFCVIAVTPFNHRWQDEYKMEYSQLGTLYANGIKDLTGSDIGLVPKPWIYDTLPKKDGYITKLDILLSCPQPFRNIAQMELTPVELRKLYQYDIDKKSRLFEASENFKLTLDESNKIKQIEIDGKPLFNSDGYAIEPDKTIKVAIDYHTADSSKFRYKEIRKSMYDGIVYELKKAEKELSENQPYPTATLIRI